LTFLFTPTPITITISLLHLCLPLFVLLLESFLFNFFLAFSRLQISQTTKQTNNNTNTKFVKHTHKQLSSRISQPNKQTTIQTQNLSNIHTNSSLLEFLNQTNKQQYKHKISDRQTNNTNTKFLKQLKTPPISQTPNFNLTSQNPDLTNSQTIPNSVIRLWQITAATTTVH